MALRTTRQMIEVLAVGSGKGRVTKQGVSVLAAGVGGARVVRQMVEALVADVSANVYQVSATSLLTITEAADRQPVRSRAAASTVALDCASYLNLEGYSAIAVTDVAAAAAVHPRTASSVVALDDRLLLVRSHGASSVLTLAQSLDYVGPRVGPAQSSLALSGLAYRCRTLVASANSSLLLSAANDVRGTIRASASSAVSLLSLADHRVYVRGAATALDLRDAVGVDYCRTASSVLALMSTAVQGQVFVQALSPLNLVSTARTNPLTAGPGPGYDFYLPATVIDLQQNVSLSIHMLAAESMLTLADALSTLQPHYAAAESTVQTVGQVYDPVTKSLVDVLSGLQDTAAVARIVTSPFAFRHYLQLAGTASAMRIKAGARTAAAESNLELGYELYRNVVGDAVNHFELTAEAVADRCLPLAALLDLEQAAAVTLAGGRRAESALVLAHSLAYAIAGNAVLQQYHPFVGEGVLGAPTPPPVALPVPTERVTTPFQLLYPATGTATDSVTLRAPNLGNKDRLGFNRIVRETRGGTLVVFADPIWPKIQTLVLTFSGLRSTQAQQLLAFLETHLGAEIGLLDWEGRTWKGVVTTPTDPVVQDGRDSFSASLEFEGELVPA
jgi:hypothetical protein